MSRFLYLSCLLVLSACSHHSDPHHYLSRKALMEPTPHHFQHCSDYGCQTIQDVELSDKEWMEVAEFFKPAPKTALEERAAIAKAIGALERVVGEKTKTSDDQKGTFSKFAKGQLDCVDESVNTTTYLSIMNQKGLIKFHDVQGPVVRLPIVSFTGWPHQTGVIIERESDQAYVVDSWFHDNGHDAEIVDLEKWLRGWGPSKAQ